MTHFPDHFEEAKTKINIDYIVSKRTYSVHSHNFVEFIFALDGSGVEIINGKEHEVTAGTFSMVMPYQVHELRCNPNHPLTFYCISINYERMLGLLDTTAPLLALILECSNSSKNHLLFNGKDLERLKYLFLTMYEEFTLKQDHWELTVKSKLTEFFVLVLRAKNEEKSLPQEEISMSGNPLFWRILYYINNHFRNELTLTSLSKEFDINPTYLCGLFKKNLGKSFVETVNTLRAHYAYTLIISTEMSITDIAFEAGFTSYRNFERVFTRLFSIAPKELRKNSKESISCSPCL